MSFIIPFFKERDTLSNKASPETESEESNDEELVHQSNRFTEKDTLNEEVVSEQEITQKRSKIMKSLTEKQNLQKKLKMPAPYYSKFRKINKPETALSVLMKYILDSENCLR